MRAKEILEKVIAAFMMLCIVCGIILMLCESEDMHTQLKTLFGGLCLFLIGVLPGIFISAREWIRDHG